MDLIEKSLVKAAGMTSIVLLIGLLIGLQLDDARTSYIDDRITEAEISSKTVVAVQNYLDSSENYCKLVREEIPELGQNNAEIGITLQQFSSKGIGKDQKYKSLRREYYVNQLRLYNTIMSYREKCNAEMNAILFFFDSNINSERQGNVLTEYREDIDDSTSIFAYNLEVNKSKVLDVLRTDFNISDGPSIVINGKVKHEGYVPLKELKQIMDENGTVNETLRQINTTEVN